MLAPAAQARQRIIFRLRERGPRIPVAAIVERVVDVMVVVNPELVIIEPGEKAQDAGQAVLPRAAEEIAMRRVMGEGAEIGDLDAGENAEKNFHREPRHEQNPGDGGQIKAVIDQEIGERAAGCQHQVGGEGAAQRLARHVLRLGGRGRFGDGRRGIGHPNPPSSVFTPAELPCPPNSRACRILVLGQRWLSCERRFGRSILYDPGVFF